MIAALVLAGGRATRLGGQDKALLPLGTGTVLDELLRRLHPQVERIAISANGDLSRFARFTLPVLPDATPEQGPLAGVLAGLCWAVSTGAETLLSVPADTPFIPADLAARLLPRPACAAAESGTHFLVATWPVALVPKLSAFLAGGGRRVRDFATEIGTRAVPFDEHPDPFFNINTPSDLARARAASTHPW